MDAPLGSDRGATSISSDSRRIDITESTPAEALLPWQRLLDERLEQLQPSPAADLRPKVSVIECGGYLLSATVRLADSVPIRSLNPFKRNLPLRSPQGLPQVIDGIDAFALHANPDLLQPWLADLAAALPRAQSREDFNRWSLCRWRAALMVPDTGATDGYQTILLECSLPDHLAEVRDGLLHRATAERGPLLAPLRQSDFGPDSWGPCALLGLRCWADDQDVVVDELRLSHPTEQQQEDDRETVFRVTLPRRALGEGVDAAYHALSDIQDRINRIFDRYAPAELRT